MIISELEMSEGDYDWFATDLVGNIGHFASGGTVSLPLSVRESKEDLDSLYHHFCSRAVLGTSTIEENLKSHKSVNGTAPNWSSFLTMSSRGLYSYDIDMNYRDIVYYLVSKPPVPLNLKDLPPDIKEILSRTTFNLEFSKTKMLGDDFFLNKIVGNISDTSEN